MNQRVLTITLRTEIDRAQRGHAPSRARAVNILRENPGLLGSSHVTHNLGRSRVRDLLSFFQSAEGYTSDSLADLDLSAAWEMLDEG